MNAGRDGMVKHEEIILKAEKMSAEDAEFLAGMNQTIYATYYYGKPMPWWKRIILRLYHSFRGNP